MNWINPMDSYSSPIQADFDWTLSIMDLSTQRTLDCTGSRNVQCVSHS